MEGYRDATGEKGVGIVGVIERPPVPTDNLCQCCSTNEQKYFQSNRYVCLYCWIRTEYSNLADKSDSEIEIMRQNTINEVKKPGKKQLVNMGSFINNDNDSR